VLERQGRGAVAVIQRSHSTLYEMLADIFGQSARACGAKAHNRTERGSSILSTVLSHAA